VTQGWTDDEVATFSALFERLNDGLAASLPSDPESSTPAPRTVTA
jgi:hypothetical protein